LNYEVARVMYKRENTWYQPSRPRTRKEMSLIEEANSETNEDETVKETWSPKYKEMRWRRDMAIDIFLMSEVYKQIKHKFEASKWHWFAHRAMKETKALQRWCGRWRFLMCNIAHRQRATEIKQYVVWMLPMVPHWIVDGSEGEERRSAGLKLVLRSYWKTDWTETSLRSWVKTRVERWQRRERRNLGSKPFDEY
jgi:hypothetical protein